MSRLIDGDALIDNICRYASPEMAWDRIDIVHKINEMPTIEERKGKWIDQNGGGCCCSECGRYALDEPDGNFIHVSVKSNFCPNCGAKMGE